MSELPPGFVLDQPAGLPPGFVLDSPNMAADVAKSAGIGVIKGGLGLLGIGGDAGSLLGSGVDKAGSVLGIEPDKVSQFKDIMARGLRNNPITSVPAGLLQGPSSHDLTSKLESVTGPLYQPKTIPGQYAQTAGEFLPGMIGGPETLGAKLVSRVLAPALASETAGQLTKDTAGEPYARIAGALAGGAGASRLLGAHVAEVVPTVDELKAASRGQYQHPVVQSVRINPDATEALATTIEHDLQHGANSGFRVANEPKVFNAVNELRLAQQEGRASTVADVDNVRQVLGNAAKERDPQGQLTRQAVAANRAINHINDFLPNLNQADLLAGNAAQANRILGQARQNWGAAKRAENVQTLASNAEINAASANSGANIQNATKQAFKPMLKNNAAKAVGYNDQELAALNQIVRGTWTGSAARAAGNLLGGGGGLGMLASGAVGYSAGGPAGAIATGLAGRGLKMIGNRSTLNAVRDLDRMIRARSPEAIRVAANNPQIAQRLPSHAVGLLSAMIAADPILSQQIGQPTTQAIR